MEIYGEGGRKIELVKEDLHIYMVCDFKENRYFRTTEVPMIRCNKLESFLPLQIRDTDGKKAVYYEITGRCTLPTWVESRKTGYEECRRILQGIRQMFSDIEEYLLSLNQVSFSIDEIFVDEKGRLLWLYTPFHEEDIQKKMEDLLLFILSVLDYHDRKALDLVYHNLHRMKREGVRQMLLEDPTEYTENRPDAGLCADSASEIPSEFNEDVSSGRKDIKIRPFPVQLLLPLAADLAAFCYLCYCVSIRGATPFLTICLTVAILAFAILFAAGMRLFIVKKDTGTVDSGPKGKVNHALGEWREDIPEKWKEDFRERWENESYDETVFLSLSTCSDKPVLSSSHSDESIEIQVFPFYIGSEAGLNQLSVKNRAVSRQHAVIVRGETGDYYLKDLNSKNGTSVNRKKALPEEMVLLKDGDEISFADDLWTFHHKKKD